MRLFADRISAPIGLLGVAVDGVGALRRLTFLEAAADDELDRFAARSGAELVWNEAQCEPVRRQLEAYFRGERREFELGLAFAGTAFQVRVWEELTRIPFAETISYGDLARRIGNPGASRAVGQANHHNPIAIVVPCHRVVGADGRLTGFGGGLAKKEMLLELERSTVGQAGLFDRP